MNWKIILLISVLFIGCGGPKDNNQPLTGDACYAGNYIIYGDNDIVDINSTNFDFLQTTAKSIAAQIPSYRVRSDLNGRDNSEFVVKATRVRNNFYVNQRKKQMCDDDLGGNRSAAHCTAFLIAPDLLLTAGHCLRDPSLSPKQVCGMNRWLFDFDDDAFPYSGSNQGYFKRSALYSCKEIVAFKNNRKEDYAIIKLDRPVTDRKAVPLLNSAELTYGSEISTLGFPLGQPMRISENGKFYKKSNDGNWLLSQVDTFSGNSGGPIIDNISKMAVGIHTHGISGAFEYDSSRRCYKLSERCKNHGVCGLTKGFNLAKIPELKSLIRASYQTNRVALGCK